MRVTSVSLLSNETEAIRFDLRNVASKSPYQIRTIIGLDAEDIIHKFYGFSATNKRYYNFSLKPKDIVMRIVLTPRFNLDEDYSFVRDNLYRTISATRTGEITLHFHGGASTIAKISGFITKFEVAYFDKTPELQLTVRCNDPMFRGMNPNLLETADLPSVDPIIKVPDSESTSPHGFQMKLTFTGTLAEFKIEEKPSDPEWEFLIVPQTSFLAGDILYFSSEFKNKYLYRERAGVKLHLMDAVTNNSIWPIIFPGFNEFHFANKASFNWNYLRFDNTYWGV